MRFLAVLFLLCCQRPDGVKIGSYHCQACGRDRVAGAFDSIYMAKVARLCAQHRNYLQCHGSCSKLLPKKRFSANQLNMKAKNCKSCALQKWTRSKFVKKSTKSASYVGGDSGGGYKQDSNRATAYNVFWCFMIERFTIFKNLFHIDRRFLAVRVCLAPSIFHI